MDRCPSCGAGLASGVSWCGLCFTRVPDRQPGGPAGAHAGASATAVAIRPPHAGTQAPLDPEQRVYSRWAKSATTHGPFGRLFFTFLVVGFGGVAYYMTGLLPFGRFFLARITCFFAAYLVVSYHVLSHVWRPVRVR